MRVELSMNGITDVHIHESRGKVGVFNAVITRARSADPGSFCDCQSWSRSICLRRDSSSFFIHTIVVVATENLHFR